MNEISQFQFDGNDIRVVTKNGQPWFVASNVADILGVINYRDTLAGFPESEKRQEILHVGNTDTKTGVKRKVSLISEPGLYRMIFQSRKPEAEKFKTWVFSEVLPLLRKTGSYSVPSDIRDKSKTVRNAYTRCLVEHGVNKPHEFIQLTYVHKEKLQIPREKKKDNYDSQELLLTTAAEMVTQWHVENKLLSGYHAIKPQAQMSAQAIFETTIGLSAIAENFTNQLEAVTA